MTTRRPRRIPLEVEGEIRRLAWDEGYGPSQIHEHLMRSSQFAGQVPDRRTVQRIVADVAPPDLSGAWLWHADPDPRPILDVLQSLLMRSHGRITAITNDQARWLHRIKAAAPTAPPLVIWQCARMYIARVTANQPTDDLDYLLALEPWKDRRAYDLARREGWFPGGDSIHPLLITQIMDAVGATLSIEEGTDATS